PRAARLAPRRSSAGSPRHRVGATWRWPGRSITVGVAMATNANAEATAAWDGPLFERFVRFRHLLTTGLSVHGEKAMDLHPPPSGARVLDIGCGFGDASEQLADIVGLEGHVHGVAVA